MPFLTGTQTYTRPLKGIVCVSVIHEGVCVWSRAKDISTHTAPLPINREGGAVLLRSGSKGDVWDAKKKRTKRRNRSGYRPAAADRLSSDLLRASRSTFGDMIHRHRHQRPQGSKPCIGYDCFAGHACSSTPSTVATAGVEAAHGRLLRKTRLQQYAIGMRCFSKSADGGISSF